MFTRVSLTLVFFFSTLALGAESLKNYSFSTYLPESARGCEVEALSMVEVFANQEGVRDITAKCLDPVRVNWDGATHTLYNIVVDYRAERAIAVQINTFGAPQSRLTSAPTDSFGVFSTYQDCLGELEARKVQTASSTGLKVFAAYCVRSQYADWSEKKYAMNLYGMGTPKARLYGFKDEFIGSNLDSETQSKILAYFDAQGVNRVWTSGLEFLYFAPAPRSLESKRLASLENVDQCNSQLGDLQSALSTMNGIGSKGVLVYCSKSSAVPKASTNLQFLGNVFPEPRAETSRNPEAYFTFESCLADRARVLEQANRGLSSNERAFAVYCEKQIVTQDRYVARYFVERKK